VIEIACLCRITLHIVKREQKRWMWGLVGYSRFVRPPEECACQSLMKRLALPAVRQGTGMREIWSLREPLWQEPYYLSEPHVSQS